MNFLKRLLDFLKRDRCNACGRRSPYTKNTHIDQRKYYNTDGGGQLCERCFKRIYPD